MSCAYQRMRSFFVLTRRKIFTVESLSISCCLVRALLWHASASYKFEKKTFLMRSFRPLCLRARPRVVSLRPKSVSKRIIVYGSDQMDD